MDRRVEAGTLHVDTYNLTFDLDAEGLPTDCISTGRKEANSLVEEFMLQTNIAVAQQIAVHIPEQALLRRHEEPLERRLVSHNALNRDENSG